MGHVDGGSVSAVLFADWVTNYAEGRFLTGSSVSDVLRRAESSLGDRVRVRNWRTLDTRSSAFEADLMVDSRIAGHLIAHGVVDAALPALPRFVDETCG